MESQKKSLVKLHPEAKDISFRHIFTIQKVFKKNTAPLFGIDYFSLMIVDSNNTLSIYSNCPSLEFNLIEKNIWMHDGIFDTNNHVDNAFYFWDELYDGPMKSVLIHEKEKKFGFEFGFFITKQINDMFIIYSFATKRNERREIYKTSKEVLIGIGDYLFYELKAIHKNYLPKKERLLTRTFRKLKLVIDNT